MKSKLVRFTSKIDGGKSVYSAQSIITDSSLEFNVHNNPNCPRFKLEWKNNRVKIDYQNTTMDLGFGEISEVDYATENGTIKLNVELTKFIPKRDEIEINYSIILMDECTQKTDLLLEWRS